MVTFTVRGVDIELEWDSIVEFLFWCLPLFVIGALVRDRVAKGYSFDLAADAAVAVAVVVSASAVVIRYCRHRCPVAVALARIRKEIRSMQPCRFSLVVLALFGVGMSLMAMSYRVGGQLWQLSGTLN